MLNIKFPKIVAKKFAFYTKYKPTTVYNLDVIISVGYRVHSNRGVQFRKWANSVLKDYLIKGYAVRNDLAQQKYDDLKALVEVMGCGLWITIASSTLQTGINA